MTNADGTWHIVVATPIGRQEVTLDLATNGSSAVSGTATTNAETVPVKNGTFDGDTLKLSVDLRSPFPMTVKYTLTPHEDTISGTAKAGPFPASKVTGNRG
ncbi:hypothetical protein NONO_c50070 [Nocardia nova SH22a]|uniref:Uncharacterized protein n=1 Tax=Nocardia nova SH22a TaxID=1415166 RepID=W5TRB8_9NOCA|nr:hypothetical protein [Nocardia nova]AHH19791.1 hypothetical protein NONO_c50070 [Nocardia nova SH22a]